jgi:hypothetical protein
MTTRLVVIADSHFHPAAGPVGAAWASDSAFNERNAAVVAQIAGWSPARVIHLGDVVHPIPGLPEHADALDVAQATYAGLAAPLRVVPGNHDVGDKPHPWAPAPSVSAGKHAVFVDRWGPPWWEDVVDGVRLIGVDTPLLHSGLPLEEDQWRWLEGLASAGPRRTFAFVHYPPFLLEPDEREHYDNLAPPGRARLLDLFARLGVEAVFCGHVHHPFWNRHAGIDYYLLPSTAFVRPEYAELGRIEPGDEYGRNDTARLGFCVVDIEAVGHRVHWVRTGGATTPDEAPPGQGPRARPPRTQLALTLRHAWDAVLDLPADGLEPFQRKRARNDLVLFATWELGVTCLRLPFDDLRQPGTRARLLALHAARGLRVVVWTAAPLSADDQQTVADLGGLIAAVECIVPRARLDAPLPVLQAPRWVSPLGRAPNEAAGGFTHFSPLGFRVDDPEVERAGGEGVVFRIEGDLGSQLDRVVATGRAAMALVSLPGAGESHRATDDAATADRVAAAESAARAHPGLIVCLDTTVDHDRGYFPRNGLLDRRGNPRSAFWRLAAMAREG